MSYVFLNMALLVNPFAEQSNRLGRAKIDTAITHGTFAVRHSISILQRNVFHRAKRYTFPASDTPVFVNFQLIRIRFCLTAKIQFHLVQGGRFSIFAQTFQFFVPPCVPAPDFALMVFSVPFRRLCYQASSDEDRL